MANTISMHPSCRLPDESEATAEGQVHSLSEIRGMSSSLNSLVSVFQFLPSYSLQRLTQRCFSLTALCKRKPMRKEEPTSSHPSPNAHSEGSRPPGFLLGMTIALPSPCAVGDFPSIACCAFLKFFPQSTLQCRKSAPSAMNSWLQAANNQIPRPHAVFLILPCAKETLLLHCAGLNYYHQGLPKIKI